LRSSKLRLENERPNNRIAIENRERLRSKSTRDYRVLSIDTFHQRHPRPSLSYPVLAAPHSHSIVLSGDNALIFHLKFFLRKAKSRLPDPSKTPALDFKEEFRRFAICSVSATIGIDRSIFLKSPVTLALPASFRKGRQHGSSELTRHNRLRVVSPRRSAVHSSRVSATSRSLG
jgi:hypothetical protein